MESNAGGGGLNFTALHARLLSFVNSRIQNGEISERALAKALGVSQPQLHNVLKGVRSLRPKLADAFLAHAGISIPDLLTKEESSTLSFRGSSKQVPSPRPVPALPLPTVAPAVLEIPVIVPRKAPESVQQLPTPVRKIG